MFFPPALRKIAAALLGLLAAALGAPAQTVATDAVGFTTLNISPNTVRALALPLDSIPAYAAAASSIGTSSLQTANAGWATDAFGPFASKPHIVRMVSGKSKGRQFRIASNTADTLNLAGVTNVNSLVDPGDQYRIFPVATLASLFGATAPSLNRSTDPEQADNVLIRGSSGWLTFYNDGTQWVRQGPGSAANNTAILPEQGFLFVRRAASDVLPITITGAVQTTNLKTDFPINSVTAFANRFPVNTTLVGLGLDQQPGWNKNADPAIADNVLLRGTSSWITFYHDGTSWIRQGPQTPNQNPVIAVGTSVVVVHRGGANITLDQALPF